MLRNGDRLTGEVLGKTDDRLILRTEYAGEITVRWSAVASLQTERPINVLVRQADEVVRGALITDTSGGLTLVAPEGDTTRLDMKEIAYLNPKPYETAKGIEYKGRAMMSAASQRGNVQSERFYGEGEFTARARLYRYTFSGKAERRKEPLGLTASNWLLGGNYDRFLGAEDKRFAYVRASAEHDRFKDIDQRRTLGGGIGFQLIETERANVSVRGGPEYVWTERMTGANENYPALGWGVKASYKPELPLVRVELFHEQDGFWNLKDTGSVTLRSKTGLRVPLIERLNAVAQYNVDWERKPAPGRKPADSLLLLGVDYTW